MSNYWNKMSLNERVGKAKGGRINPGTEGGGKAKRKGKGPNRKTEEEVLKKAYPGQFRNENNEYTLTPKKNTKGKAKGGRIGLRDRVFAKGGKVGKKSQGFRAREDESLGMRTGKESTKKQSMKDRRDESYGKFGKRKNQRINKAKGGKVNTSRENRLEELGRVDSEKAFSKKGKRNLRGEKRRIVRELKK